MSSMTLILGAGFSKAAGSPLAAELFDIEPFGGAQWRNRLIERVLVAWDRWTQEHDGGPEVFITEVYRHRNEFSGLKLWQDIVQFLAMRLAQDFARWYKHDSKSSRSSDNIFEAQIPFPHELWWNALFKRLGLEYPLTVITTNWDIWIERGLRPRSTPRRLRPGFHYGFGKELLAGVTGHPHSEYRRNPEISGSVALLKLHVSVSWAVEKTSLVKYGDCRPAFRGDAAMIPPIQEKETPEWLKPVWELALERLKAATTWLIVGYSVPDYDVEIGRLLKKSGVNRPLVHVFAPHPEPIAERLGRWVEATDVILHGPIPEACGDLADMQIL